MTASLIGHGGQAQLADRPGSFTRVTLLFAIWWPLFSGAAARMHWIRVWRASLLDALEGAADIFGFIHPVVRVGRSGWDRGEAGLSAHAAASDPRRKSEPSTHIRWSTTAILRATATIARRRPLVFIKRTPQALRLDQAIERISMALAAAYSVARTSASPAWEMRPGASPPWNGAAPCPPPSCPRCASR